MIASSIIAVTDGSKTTPADVLIIALLIAGFIGLIVLLYRLQRRNIAKQAAIRLKIADASVSGQDMSTTTGSWQKLIVAELFFIGIPAVISVYSFPHYSSSQKLWFTASSLGLTIAFVLYLITSYKNKATGANGVIEAQKAAKNSNRTTILIILSIFIINIIFGNVLKPTPAGAIHWPVAAIFNGLFLGLAIWAFIHKLSPNSFTSRNSQQK